MNKKILSLILAGATLVGGGIAFADRYAPGDGYDPVSPGDPSMRYLLETTASPNNAGSAYPSASTYSEGSEVYVYTYGNTNFVFAGWYDGDSIVSTSTSFYYTMPGHNVKLQARYNYLPTSPSGPMEDGYTHRVKITCDPANGGTTNRQDYFLMLEGTSTYLYAYPNSNFKFDGWKINGEHVTPNEDGTIKNPLLITMEDKNLDINLSFSYSPNSPGDPMPNSYNRATNELIVDNFTPGNLQGTINELVSDRRYNINKDEIYSLIVAGRMDDYDRYFGYGMTECAKVDLVRTSGLEYFDYQSIYNMGALTEILLPSSLLYIDSNTFIYNPYLTSIVCYAPVPPYCWEEKFNGFDYPDGNIATGVVAKVPASSLSLYKEAPGWKHLSLEPIESADCSITVNLPADAGDGRYKGMYIVLENPGSGQTQRYVVNDRVTYVFENLIMNVSGLNLYYNVYLRNQDGDDLAYYPNILLTEETPMYIVDFPNVKGVYDLELEVLQDDSKNVADELNIVWKNSEGGYVASGVKAAGVLEGKEVTATITLPDSYGVQYEIPEPVKFISGADGNKVVIKLVAYPREIAEGVMTSSFNNEPIPGGYVTVEQTLASKYRYTATGVTDKDGKYRLQYIAHSAATGKVTARADGFVTQPCSVESFENWDEMKDFEMKSISGSVVSVALTWLAPGDIKASAYTDFSNIDFTLFNNTTNKKIQNFSNQAPLLVIPDEAKAGDKIMVTVSSRSGVFDDVSAEALLDDDRKGDVEITIKEHGKIACTYSNTDATNVRAMLYDKEGKLLKHKMYDSKKAVSFTNLTEGDYTLVAFADSPYFTGFSNLSDLLRFEGFDQGADYLMENVTVSDGDIATLDLGVIPMFDESKFYKTDPSLTLLKVNKTSVTASNYVTLSTRFQFLPEYKGWAKNVKLVYEFPEHVEYVKNSVVNGDETGNLTAEGNNRYSLDNVTPGTTVRFCVMPEKGGSYYPTASLEFDYLDTHYTQPLGSFYFQGVDFQLFVPKKTSKESVWARGVATNGGDVTLFVGGVPMSSAKASGSGDWLADVPLLNTDTKKLHQIYGEIVSPKGTFPTESAVVEYDPEYPELDFVRMVHNGAAVDFHHGKAKTSVKSYSYNPDRDIFTLNAKFLENKENVETVNFHIMSSDGSEREIDAVYSSGNDIWIASLGYPDSFRLPVNVTVDYTYKKSGTNASNFYMDYIAPDVQPIIDPSGFVYEANEDNRVEGATVTVFYREAVEDQFETTWQSVKWDATEYGQENPLLTDKEGLYGWDVPAGEWQVKYEKKGYETAFSKWLQVPPPQLEVNMNLVRNDAPFVKEARAYDGGKGIEIIFDHYMDLTSLEDNIYILKDSATPGADDEVVYGTITVEKNNEDSESTIYFDAIRFMPGEAMSSTTDKVHLIVSKQAKSYSGVEMAENYEQEITIEKEITSVSTDESDIEIQEGDVMEVVISAVPADAAIGKVLHVTNKSPYVLKIDETNQSANEEGALLLTLDEKGQARISMEGIMAGQSELDLKIEGSNVTGKTYVDVVAEVKKLSRPTSSLPDKSTVYRGVLAELSSRYTDGVIYYTTDGSDPTPSTGNRYTGGIPVTNDMVIKAIVVSEGKVSEIAEFNYSLKGSLMDLSINEGWSWVSHNMETPVKVKEVLSGDMYRLLSQTEELIKDSKYGWVGTLQEMHPHQSYKVASRTAGNISVSDIAYNPNQPIPLRKGWNWIGYPIDQTMDLDEAFVEGSCEDGDVLETLSGGSAVYQDGKWIGSLAAYGMKPGLGYLYFTNKAKEISYNTNVVSTAAARLAIVPQITAQWVADKFAYPSLMPMVVEIVKEGGLVAEEGEYEVGAFCGTECRGVGQYIDGYLFLTVHGDPGDEISFRLQSNNEDKMMEIQNTIVFTDEPVGTLDNPYRLDGQTLGIQQINVDSDVTVVVKNRLLYIDGAGVGKVAVYDLAGNKILSTTNVESPISLNLVAPGVHIIAVESANEWSYHKVMIK